MDSKHFTSALFFRRWLEQNHNKKNELWVGFYKKASGKPGMSYKEAVDEALCFGWIDGLVKRYDDMSYMQRFTPRRPKSIWSKINTQNIERLRKSGKLMPSGEAAVEAAERDGRWQAAYDSPKSSVVPKDFLKALSKHAEAMRFFKTLNKTNTYSITYRLQRSKNRKKCIEDIIVKLTEHKIFH